MVQNRRARLPVWADADTAELLMSRFAYVFVQPAGSLYPPILDLRPIDGPLRDRRRRRPDRLPPVPRRSTAASRRSASASTTSPTCPTSPPSPTTPGPTLAGLDTFMLDALRRTPHPTHAHLAQSLEWIARAAPRLGVLTNMHNDLDYATLAAELPAGVIPAHDGLALEIAGVILDDPRSSSCRSSW